MGDDQRIVDAARVSYGDGTKKTRSNAGLIDYLIRHKHSSPVEKVRFEFHVKAPIFVARQWMRHRMSSINEISGRYSVLKDEFYQPAEWRGQAAVNRQGSEGVLDNSDMLREAYTNEMAAAFDCYHERLNQGVAREMARISLPLSTYTEWYWTIDLHNLMHFIRLRKDSHAQLEIQEYAKLLEQLATPVAPLAFAAFDKHVVNAMTLSSYEIEFIRDYNTYVSQYGSYLTAEEFLEDRQALYDETPDSVPPPYVGLSKGQRLELLAKLDRLAP